MKPIRNLRLRLRLIEGALVLSLGALTTAAVATHQLLLDAYNRPTGDVSFSAPHWVGTLDAARLPASVPLLDGGNVLTASGYQSGTPGTDSYTMVGQDAAGVPGCGVYTGGELICNGPAALDAGMTYTDGYGTLYVTNDIFLNGGLLISGNLMIDNAGVYADANGDVVIDPSGNFYPRTVTAGGGITMFGRPALNTQPATPTNQAQIIALLQTYGLCQ